MIEMLSDNELSRLGLQTIGDRHRLREHVKSFLSIASTESQKDEEPREANRNQQGRSSSGLITDIQREREDFYLNRIQAKEVKMPVQN